MPFCAILRANNPRGVTPISTRKTAKKPTAKSKPAKAAPVKKTAAKPVKKAAAKPAAKTLAKAAPKPAAKSKAPAKKSSPGNAVDAMCKQIVKVLDTNKGENITTLNLRNKCSFADYMIVASGRAPRHVAALADYVADMLKKSGTPPLSIEGKDSGDWVLIDAGDIVVHIFRPEVRQFYNIEKMWAIPALNP